MQRLDGRVVIAGVVAMAGVVVAWRALHRPRAAPASSPRQIEEMTPSDNIHFERLDTLESIESYLIRFTAMMEAEAEGALESIGVPSSLTSSLTTVAERRLWSVVSPDRVDWREVAREEGAEEFPAHDASNGRRDRHLDWRLWWSQARFATSGIRVRRLRLDDKYIYMTQLTTASRNAYRARYPIDDRTSVVEVLIPVKVPVEPGGAPNTPAHLGIAYWWSSSERQWKPATMTVYNNRHIDIVAPPM